MAGFGRMKSDKATFGRPSAFFDCWRSVWNTAFTVPFSSYTSISSPEESAGKIPTTALAVIHFSSMILLSITFASLKSFVASSPRTGSFNIFG